MNFLSNLNGILERKEEEFCNYVGFQIHRMKRKIDHHRDYVKIGSCTYVRKTGEISSININELYRELIIEEIDEKRNEIKELERELSETN